MANNLPEKKLDTSPVPSEASPAPQSKKFTPLTLFLILLITLSLGVIFFFDSIVEHPLVRQYLMGTKPKKELAMVTKEPTPTPTPTPIVLKPDEGTKGNYSVSQAATNTGPAISKVIFDPLDVKKGQDLTVTVVLSSESPITGITGTLISDTKSTPVTLNMVSITGSSHVWSATLPITDTLWYKYILHITATNSDGSSTVTVAPRS